MEIILTIALIGMAFALHYSHQENRRLEGLLIKSSKSRHPAYRKRMEETL
ncbi:hypothetical protein NYP18_09005 [Corynebacterium sp. YIM 101645]|uniref:Secreted protein n=1 Tax=Corynebacterium lemuris TaxID=1859292 RepID=A0ABT2G0H8_9CORY|nr:hypothetical protein [Corynebacterium lemuris]MCS5479797.1 hypothetical protein [Corynebacterium lemuris]